MRRVALILILLLACLALVLRFDHLESVLSAVRSAQPAWLAASLAVQALWQGLQVEQVRAGHRLAGSPQPWRSLLSVVVANNCVIVLAPSGSLSTFVLFVADARRRGLKSSPVILGVALFAIFESIALSFLALVTLGLQFNGTLAPVAWPPAAIILSLTAVYLTALWLGIHALARLEGGLRRLVHAVNALARRLFGRDAVAEAAIARTAATLAGDLAALGRQPAGAWLRPLGLALLTKGALLALLAVSGLAFDQRLAWSTLITAVALASTLTIASPTPLGIGIVEGVLAYTLSESGVGMGPSLLISLMYRSLTLWLPAIYGFVALQVGGLRSLTAQAVD